MARLFPPFRSAFISMFGAASDVFIQCSLIDFDFIYFLIFEKKTQLVCGAAGSRGFFKAAQWQKRRKHSNHTEIDIETLKAIWQLWLTNLPHSNVCFHQEDIPNPKHRTHSNGKSKHNNIAKATPTSRASCWCVVFFARPTVIRSGQAVRKR